MHAVTQTRRDQRLQGAHTAGTCGSTARRCLHNTSSSPILHCCCNSICIRISMAGQCLPHVPHVKLKNAPPTDATSCHRLLPNCKTAKQLQQLPSMPPASVPPSPSPHSLCLFVPLCVLDACFMPHLICHFLGCSTVT